MKRFGEMLVFIAVVGLSVVSCEILDDDPETNVNESRYVELSEVAQIFAGIPIEHCHIQEVHDAVCSSSGNGYDEEYTMTQLFECPGSGVGDSADTRSVQTYQRPLRALIQEHLLATKSVGGIPDPQRWLDELVRSDIQIYWPFSQNWDRKSFPVITFDPEDDSDVNIGYRVRVDTAGIRSVEEVVVDEQLAMSSPVWVINRNSDASYKTLEMLRKENPELGEGGGSVIVAPSTKALTKDESKSLILKDFVMKRNYDCWFAGGSEFFVLTITGGCSFA